MLALTRGAGVDRRNLRQLRHTGVHTTHRPRTVCHSPSNLSPISSLPAPSPPQSPPAPAVSAVHLSLSLLHCVPSTVALWLTDCPSPAIALLSFLVSSTVQISFLVSVSYLAVVMCSDSFHQFCSRLFQPSFL